MTAKQDGAEVEAAPEPTPEEQTDAQREAQVLAAIAARRQQQAEDCLAEVGAVLEKHGCTLQVVPQLVPLGNGVSGISGQVQVVIKPDQ